jgi:hypothetical protein
MKASIFYCLIAGVLVSTAHAQAPTQEQIMQQLGPEAATMMSEMQRVQEKYVALEAKREAERKAIGDRVAQEELARARANAAALQSRGIDPGSAAEVATRERMAPYYEQWKAEDAELEAQKQADMQEAMSKAGLMIPMPRQ